MKKKEKCAAVLTIHDASNMSADGIKSIISWFQRQLRFVKKNRKQFSKRFTARYLY